MTLARDAESTDALIALADDAMDQAKDRGRNRVVGLEAMRATPASADTENIGPGGGPAG